MDSGVRRSLALSRTARFKTDQWTCAENDWPRHHHTCSSPLFLQVKIKIKKKIEAVSKGSQVLDLGGRKSEQIWVSKTAGPGFLLSPGVVWLLACSGSLLPLIPLYPNWRRARAVIQRQRNSTASREQKTHHHNPPHPLIHPSPHPSTPIARTHTLLANKVFRTSGFSVLTFFHLESGILGLGFYPFAWFPAAREAFLCGLLWRWEHLAAELAQTVLHISRHATPPSPHLPLQSPAPNPSSLLFVPFLSPAPSLKKLFFPPKHGLLWLAVSSSANVRCRFPVHLHTFLF